MESHSETESGNDCPTHLETELENHLGIEKETDLENHSRNDLGTHLETDLGTESLTDLGIDSVSVLPTESGNHRSFSLIRRRIGVVECESKAPALEAGAWAPAGRKRRSGRGL